MASMDTLSPIVVSVNVQIIGINGKCKCANNWHQMSKFNVQLTLFRAPKYTFSRKTKDGGLSDKANPTKNGIGWSEAGLVKYNELYDFVVEDHLSRVAVFNNELLNVFVGRQQERNTKPDREPESKRHKTVHEDDMIGPYNTSYVNVLDSGMPRDIHPSMQLL